MTRLELQNAVIQWVNNDPGATASLVQSIINKVYLSIAIPFRFHEVETTKSLDIVAGTKGYTVNTTDLYAIHHAYDREYGRELAVRDPWELDTSEDDEDIEGAPEMISRFGSTVSVHPVPDYTLTAGIKLYGVKLPAALAADGDSPVYPLDWHYFIELQSAAMCAFMLGKDERGQLLQNLALGQLAGRQESHTIEAFTKALKVNIAQPRRSLSGDLEIRS